MKNNIFEYSSYKTYLADVLAKSPNRGFGMRSQMARALNCQVAYVSQVLSKQAHFSLEQAEELNQFLGHSPDEAHFFLLLVQLERAGSEALRKRIRTQMEQSLEKRFVLKERVDIKQSLSLTDQATYYGAWYYAAIHILTTIPKFQNKAVIAEYLELPLERVSLVLEFLISVGLVVQEKGMYKSGLARIFLGSDSPMIGRHHTNWRLRAIDSLDRPPNQDLHLSTVVSLSTDDVLKIKEQLLTAIDKARATIKESKEEELHCLNVDFFRV